MFNPTRGPARREVSGRDKLDQQELDNLQAAGTIIVDERRARPLYFDGRFLAARDLTREQNYFLTRQADLGKAGGLGVVSGLMVEPGPSSTSIVITAGHGITPSGELVVLPESITVQLANVAETQRLDAAFGLARIPRESPRNRSGLFVVALRAVEFTANPIASYPTTINSTRSVEDGDIVEGVAVTLIPFPDEGSSDQPGLRRARVAREIFVDGGTRNFPAGALPLAMIALDRGGAQWIDPFMVRREVGAEHGDILNLGFAPRALREAHLLQYDNHLRAVYVERDKASRGRRFAASEHFFALPPAGRMPAAAINPADFTQIYFPPEVDVDLSIIPDDEVAALLEDSLLLPPIDLTLSGDEQESTSVLVLIPLPRRRIRTIRNTLPTLRRALLPAAPGLLARRKPLEVLQGLTLPKVIEPIVDTETLVDAAWRSALARSDTLFYIRRRNLNFKAEAAGIDLRMFANEFLDEQLMEKALKAWGAQSQYTKVRSSASTEAEAEMVYMFASPKFMESRLLTFSALNELYKARTTMGDEIPELKGKAMLNRAGVMKVAERYNDPKLGEGINRMVKDFGGDFTGSDKIMKALASSGVVPELDRVARSIRGEKDLDAFVKAVVTFAQKGEAANVREVVEQKLKEI